TGAIRQKMDDNEAAQAAYAAAARIQPLIRRPAAKAPADFRVLALYAPFAGNTPAEYLFSNAAHDTDTLSLLDDSEIDLAGLSEVQLVVNLISDADQGGGVLPLAADSKACRARRCFRPDTRRAAAVLVPRAGAAGWHAWRRRFREARRSR